MLSIRGRGQAHCDGVNRRDFLKLGCLGAGGLTLPDLLRARAAAELAGHPRSVIMVCLPGGPSHLDMYDMKPDAPTRSAASSGRSRRKCRASKSANCCRCRPSSPTSSPSSATWSSSRADHQLQRSTPAFPAPQAPFMSPPGSAGVRLHRQPAPAQHNPACCLATSAWAYPISPSRSLGGEPDLSRVGLSALMSRTARTSAA